MFKGDAREERRRTLAKGGTNFGAGDSKTVSKLVPKEG